MSKHHTSNSVHLAMCFVGLVLLGSCSPATEPPPPEPARITKGPYVQNVTQDGISIMWETSRPTMGSVLYGVGGELANEAATEFSARIQEVRLSGLSPATEYGYRVIADGLTSEIHTFATAVADGSPFSAGGFYHASDRLELKNLLHPIFEQYEVDFVFSGHDHNYERMLPIGSKNVDHKVSYVIAGNGGTPLRWVGTREWTVHAQRVFGFVTVDIDGPRLHLQSHTLDGDVIDELALDKDDQATYDAYLGTALDFEAIEDPVVATDHYETGDDLADEDLFEEALVEFLAAYEADPTCIEAVDGIADSLLELGRTEEAIEWALRGIETLPQFTGTYEVLVEGYHALGNDDTAFEWASRWREIAPDSTGPDEAVAEIHLDRGEPGAAIEALERALAILPSDAEIHFDLGRLYEQSGDVESALLSNVRGLYWFMEEHEQDEEDLQEYLEIRNRVAASLNHELASR